MAKIGFLRLLSRTSIFLHPRRILSSNFRRNHCKRMVTLIVATTIDPASIGPASALLAMPGWHPGPPIQGKGSLGVTGNVKQTLAEMQSKAAYVRLPDPQLIDMASFVNQDVRLLKHDRSIVREDYLDKHWEEATGETVDEVIFLSKHTAASKRPALTVHPIGVPHLKEGEETPVGGKPAWAALPNPRIGPWFRLLKSIAESQNLTPEFEVTLEATHHGPLTNAPTMFVEIGSTEEYWKRQDAAQAIALLVWEGLGLNGGAAVGDWSRFRYGSQQKILLGIGGGHYVPRHMDIVLKDGVWVGHLLAGYSLPMEDPGPTKAPANLEVGGTWRQAIRVAFDTTRAAFPKGEVLAHIDNKSFKGWQKNAIVGFLAEQNIKVGKPSDFY